MRSVADALRRFSEPELAGLLRARPDLCLPAPQDFADLAARLSTPGSVRRALDTLNLPQLTVAEAVAALPEPVAVTLVTELVGFPAHGQIAALQSLALLWGTAEALRPVRGLRQAFEPYPGGLAGPATDPRSAQDIQTALSGLPPGAGEVLDKLMWGPPTGAVRDADRTVVTPATPIDHLLARGLLRAVDSTTVVLPREVALTLRGRFSREPVGAEPPVPQPGPRSRRIVDSAAVGAAYEFVHELEGVLDKLARRAPAPLRTGGLAARDLAGLVRSSASSPQRTGFILEVAGAAGLITTSGAAIAPTEGFDAWLALPSAARYLRLLRAWLTAPRWFAAARTATGRPLMTEAATDWSADLRAQVLAPLAAGVTVASAELSAYIAWHRPSLRRAGDLADLTAEVLTEADWLGLTALGQASALVAGCAGELDPATAAMFPDLVDQVVVQSDLTAVATGPLDRETAAGLALLADAESRGGGGVYRFSQSSVRRAFDAGWDAAQVEDWLAAHSRTGLPQPLRYLIGDVARLHGIVRVGAARAYVRIDDPARLRMVLAHPEAAALGVRQVGPEALVADAEPTDVVALLRAAGLAPAAEDAAGTVLITPAVRRAPAPRRNRSPEPAPDAVAAALLARRATHRAPLRTEETLAVLTRANAESRPVRVDWVDADGNRASGTVVPLELSAGMVRLAGPGAAFSVPLARVTGARWPESAGGPD